MECIDKQSLSLIDIGALSRSPSLTARVGCGGFRAALGEIGDDMLVVSDTSEACSHTFAFSTLFVI